MFAIHGILRKGLLRLFTVHSYGPFLDIVYIGMVGITTISDLPINQVPKT